MLCSIPNLVVWSLPVAIQTQDTKLEYNKKTAIHVPYGSNPYPFNDRIIILLLHLSQLVSLFIAVNFLRLI